MNKKKILLFLLATIAILISNIYILKYLKFFRNDNEIKLSYILKSDKEDSFQIFYDENGNFTEDKSQTIEYRKVYRPQIFEYFIPKESNFIRIDFGNISKVGNNTKKLEIEKIKIEYNGKEKKIDILDIQSISNKNGIIGIEKKRDLYDIKIEGDDAFIVLSPKILKIQEFISETKDGIHILFAKIILCLLANIIILMMTKKAKNIFSLMVELKNNRVLILNLAKNDFKTKYAGSYLGIVWAFVNPVVTILVYWFVFEFGLRAGAPQPGIPFILWLMSGLTPWFFFSDGLNNATNCMQEYSYLVKKVVFKISILPIVKIISTLFIHLVFIGFLLIVAFCYKFYPTVYTIQIFYYLFCLFFIILATSYATSAIVLFFKDLGQIINIFLQIGVWMTPIMWNFRILPKKYQWIVKLNPMVYITEGYRDVFINRVWFWTKPEQTIYFWLVCLVIFIIGMLIFRKLKPHFADVL